ncbi:hypothetical protein V6N12_053442 [Hibiscus sabdariffa]|uniref:HMA domain-containing protein n=1 Tax=Hibiscus sabdariffa TaxID=183260 RepID=A0ABR2D7L2_9ROSI
MDESVSAVDRHNPITRDAKRFNTNTLPSNQISLRKKGKGPSSSKSKNDHKKTCPSVSNKARGIDLVTPPENKIQAITQDHSIISKPSSSSFNDKPPKDQVVVLRVSLHRKGCEGKLRKHLSRMEGVTSFSIDFKVKKGDERPC